jgi:hypothetical protein
VKKLLDGKDWWADDTKSKRGAPERSKEDIQVLRVCFIYEKRMQLLSDWFEQTDAQFRSLMLKIGVQEQVGFGHLLDRMVDFGLIVSVFRSNTRPN